MENSIVSALNYAYKLNTKNAATHLKEENQLFSNVNSSGKKISNRSAD